jgi:hypothetical protein
VPLSNTPLLFVVSSRSVTFKRQDRNGTVWAERIVGCCEPASLATRLAFVNTLTAASALAVLILAGCAGANSAAQPSASPPSSPATSPSPAAVAATTSGPTLTGFGATLAQWKTAHTLDLSVSARNAYLPRVAGSDGEDTWQVVTVAGGRVISYTLNVLPSSLRSAEARARQELPADAQVLWRHTFGDTCAQEQFRSATLAAALGDGQVNVEFDNAVSGNVTPVTEELFSTYDAPTVALAPHC